MGFIAEISRKTECVSVDKEFFMNTLSNPLHVNNIAEIRRQQNIIMNCNDKSSPVYKDASKKKAIIKCQLPGFIFQCVGMERWHKIDSKKNDWGEGFWRSQEHSILNGLAMIDIDHIDNPLELFKDKIHPWMESHEGVIQLVYITPSGFGLKVVFIADINRGNLMSNQLWLGGELGIEVDDSCKDASRLSFASTKDDILFIGDKLFDYYDEEYSRKYTPLYNKGLSQPDLFKEKKDPIPSANKSENVEVPSVQENKEEFTYLGLKPFEIMTKMLEGQNVVQGMRHKILLNLVADSRYFCDRDAQIIRINLRKFDWFNELEQENASEVDRTINDAMAFPMKPYLPKQVREVLKGLKNGGGDNVDYEKENAAKFEEFGQLFAEKFKYYPCMRAVCRDMPLASYPAMIFASAAMFGTLLTRCTYHFYDKPQVARRFNYGIMIIADPASRKSMVEYLNDLIMKPVKLADDLGNDAINEYKKERTARSTSTKEQKKEALVKPDVKIRIHGTRTANGVFIEDMVNCKEIVNGELMHLHLYTFDSELDSAKIASSGGQWIDKSIFELKSFHNETDNQQYKNLESVNGPFKVYWNYVYTGTPLSLGRKVNERNFGSGLFSRLAVIPLCADIFEMMPFAKMDKKLTQFDEEISKWADILDKVSGELPLNELVKVTYNWTKEKMEIAQIEKSKRDAQLCKRVAWYGINISAPFILMRHFKEWQEKRTFVCDKEDLALCELVMDVQFFSQNIYFGTMADMYFKDKENSINSSQPRNCYEVTKSYWDALPRVFSPEDLAKVTGIKSSSNRSILFRWKKMGVIEEKKKNNKKVYEKVRSL